MTTEVVTQFFERRPFVPFEMFLADGRIIQMAHPENGTLGMHALTVSIYGAGYLVEVVDVTLIVSMRILVPTDIDD